jgi:hypothetical protein
LDFREGEEGKLTFKMNQHDKDKAVKVSLKPEKQLLILHEDEFQRSLRHRNLPPIEKLKS